MKKKWGAQQRAWCWRNMGFHLTRKHMGIKAKMLQCCECKQEFMTFAPYLEHMVDDHDILPEPTMENCFNIPNEFHHLQALAFSSAFFPRWRVVFLAIELS